MQEGAANIVGYKRNAIIPCAFITTSYTSYLGFLNVVSCCCLVLIGDRSFSSKSMGCQLDRETYFNPTIIQKWCQIQQPLSWVFLEAASKHISLITDPRHQKLLVPASLTATIQTHSRERWMWWNQCENGTKSECFLFPLRLCGRPLSNSSQLPAHFEKLDTCQLPSSFLPPPGTDTYSPQKIGPGWSTVPWASLTGLSF